MDHTATVNDIGRGFGRYTVYEKIGSGTFATVYRAENTALKRTVALKLLDQEYFHDRQANQAFIKEAQLLATLVHPHIVRVLDFAEQDGWLFMVMEYMSGGDLGHWQKNRHQKPSFRQIVQIVEDVASALDYAHEQGLVHGDVKPQNILLDERERAKLGDFGLLRAIDRSAVTSGNVTKGTPYYNSPEQAKGEALQAASDQYSLGIVTYELLTGQVPFRGDIPTAIYVKHVDAVPPPMNQSNELVTEQLEQVVMKALSKKAEDRYANCTEFAQELQYAVAATESQQFKRLLTDAVQALAARQIAAARLAIEGALRIMPDDAQVQNLLEKVEVEEQAQRSYEIAAQNLEDAETKAKSIRQNHPHHTDPDKLLAELAPPKPEKWQAWRDHWQLALLIAGFIIFLAMAGGIGASIYTATDYGDEPRSTLVSIVRTSTPTPTLTPTHTPTSTPTHTPTSTPTHTPTSTPTHTPTSTPTHTPTYTPTPTPTPPIIRANNVELIEQLAQFGIGAVREIDISSDGEQVAIASSLGVYIYGLQTPSQLILDVNPANSIAFSPDGELVASGSEDGTIRLWDGASGEPFRLISLSQFLPVEATPISTKNLSVNC